MMYLRIFSLHFRRCLRQWQCMLDFFVCLFRCWWTACHRQWQCALEYVFFCFVSENANKEYDYDSMSLMILNHCKYSEHDFFFCLFQNYYITIYLFFSEFFNLFPCSPLAVKDCQNVDLWRCAWEWTKWELKAGPLICRTRSHTGFCCQMMTGPLSTSSSTVRLEKSASAKCWHRLHQRTSTKYDWLILIYQFYRVLFSALMQTHCTFVACDCEWVTVAFYMAHFSISTEVVDLQHCLLCYVGGA